MKLLSVGSGKVSGCVALLIGVGLTLPAVAQNFSPRAVTVVHLHGKGRFSNDRHSWQPLKDASTIMPGGIIQAADNSSVAIRFGEKDSTSEVEISANSVLAIDRLTTATTGTAMTENTELTLQTGEISGQVKQLDPQSQYEINFPTGIAGIRGGAYRLTSAGRLTVTKGEAVIVLSKPEGSPAQVVTAGHRFDPATGMIGEIPAAPAEPAEPKPALESHPGPMPVMRPGNGLGGALRKY